jgi:hypothetical protein
VTGTRFDAGRTIHRQRWESGRSACCASAIGWRRWNATGLSGSDALNRALISDRVDVALAGLAFDEERIPFISGDGFYTTADYAALGTTLVSEDDAEGLARASRGDSCILRDRDREHGARDPHRLNAASNDRRARDRRCACAGRAAVGEEPVACTLRDVPCELPGGSARAIARARPGDHRVKGQARAARIAALRGAGIPARGAERHRRIEPSRRTEVLRIPRAAAHDHIDDARRSTCTGSFRGRADPCRDGQGDGEAGFSGSFAEFLTFLRSDPRFYVDAIRYGEKASEIAKRADEGVARIVGHLPRLTYGVRAMPAGLESSSNGYLAGSPEQGIAGMVVYKPWMAEKMPTYGLPAWVLHEGVPGHHLQISLSQELTDLPEFRRNDDITAYVEGWGLYSEKLGEDMGIYRDAYERFGRLSLEMWRACRLVIDTGMHAMGWSRDQAVACLRDNSALADTEIQFEVDRYIAWPGQALAYKVGEQRLLALRRRAEERLGTQFDLRRFHDRVLGQGAMPLAVLEAEIDRWIAAGGH